MRSPFGQDARRLASTLLLLSFASRLALVAANVEKIIFIGPSLVNIPQAPPSLPDLNLHTLTPQNWSIRTNLSRVFPAEWHNAAQGYASWLLLDGLDEGQRYEFKVCWAATVRLQFPL